MKSKQEWSLIEPSNKIKYNSYVPDIYSHKLWHKWVIILLVYFLPEWLSESAKWSQWQATSTQLEWSLYGFPNTLQGTIGPLKHESKCEMLKEKFKQFSDIENKENNGTYLPSKFTTDSFLFLSAPVSKS